MNTRPSKRGRQLLPTSLFSTQHISFLEVLHGEIKKSTSPKEVGAAKNRYLSHFTNSLHAAASAEAVKQLMALPCPNSKLERQLRNKLRQLATPQQTNSPLVMQFAL